MQQSARHNHLDIYNFPQQKVLCENKPYSRDLLHSLLEIVYTDCPPLTGYLKFTDDEDSLLFLFFFNGTPYAAGKYTHGKPAGYSIQELGRYLAKSADDSLRVTLCETDPVLLKSMMLFMQEEPDVKAPPSLLDFEYIVRQIGEVGEHAMIAVCRNNMINFFFFREGKGALAYYADPAFERPRGMSIDEEMLLYAFQPGDKVQAYIFRDMIIAKSEDSSQLDKDSLYKLLTVGYLKDRRSDHADRASHQENRRGENSPASPMPASESIEAPVMQKPKLPSVALSVESGSLRGERFTVTLPCTIGRKDCDLIFDDRLISRRHAELKVVGNKLVIEDLASKNGTRVNGKTVTTKQLVPNDLISIGPMDLRVSRAT